MWYKFVNSSSSVNAQAGFGAAHLTGGNLSRDASAEYHLAVLSLLLSRSLEAHFRASDSEFLVQVFGFRVSGSGVGVQGFRFRVSGSICFPGDFTHPKLTDLYRKSCT